MYIVSDRLESVHTLKPPLTGLQGTRLDILVGNISQAVFIDGRLENAFLKP